MKRLSIILFYVLLGLGAVAGTFSLLALTSGSAYAHETDQERDGGRSRSVNETRNAKPDAEVRIDDLAGTVKVKGWDKNQVSVSGTLGEDVERLEINGDDADIEIRVVLPHRSDSEDCESCADLEIYVPAGSRLEVNTVSADVEAQGITGQVHAGTVSGNVVFDTSAARIEAKSTSGDVTVTGSAKGAHVSANSISGMVRVTHVDGDLRAESVSGDVKVSSSTLTEATLSSTSGNLDYSGPLQKGGQYEFNNVSGDLTLAVGSSPDARFDISSFSGDIDNTFGPRPTRVSKYSPGVELHFTNGNGSAQLSARTLSGDVHLQN